MRDHRIHGGFIMPVWDRRHKFLYNEAYVSVGDVEIDFKMRRLAYRWFPKASAPSFDIEGDSLPNPSNIVNDEELNINRFEFLTQGVEFDSYILANADLLHPETGTIAQFIHAEGLTDAYEQRLGYRPRILAIRVTPNNESLMAPFMDLNNNRIHDFSRDATTMPTYHDVILQRFPLVADLIERAIVRAGDFFKDATRVAYPPQIQAMLDAAKAQG